MKKWLSLIVILVLAPGVNAETRYFLDGVLGQADQKNTIGGFDTISGSDSSKGLRAGFYLSRTLGVELTYTDYGVTEDDFINASNQLITDTLDTRMTGVGLQGILPLGNKINLIGRAGIASWDLKFTETNSLPDDEQGVDAYFGLGLRFDIEKNVRVAVEYENLSFEAPLGNADTDHTVDNVAISLGVTF